MATKPANNDITNVGRLVKYASSSASFNRSRISLNKFTPVKSGTVEPQAGGGEMGVGVEIGVVVSWRGNPPILFFDFSQ